MFNLGFGEILIICAVLIIVVGPERLPTLMKTVGKTLRTVRQASQEIKATVGLDELMREDITRPLPPPKPRLAPVATVSRDADKPVPIADTTSGTVSGAVTGTVTAAVPAGDTAATGESDEKAPLTDASEEVVSKPVMWANIPAGKVVPYVEPTPPAVPSLAEADGLSISERMLLLHAPPPPPVEPPSVPELPNTAPDSAESHRDTRGSATTSATTSDVTPATTPDVTPDVTPDANSAGDAGGGKGVV